MLQPDGRSLPEWFDTRSFNRVHSVYGFHRELPYGVPGAYRILANVLPLRARQGSESLGPFSVPVRRALGHEDTTEEYEVENGFLRVLLTVARFVLRPSAVGGDSGCRQAVVPRGRCGWGLETASSDSHTR